MLTQGTGLAAGAALGAGALHPAAGLARPASGDLGAIDAVLDQAVSNGTVLGVAAGAVTGAAGAVHAREEGARSLHEALIGAWHLVSCVETDVESGPFCVDEARGTVEHEMAASLFPNLKGQRRTHHLASRGAQSVTTSEKGDI